MRRTTRGLISTTFGLGVVLTGCSPASPPPRIDSADVSASGSSPTTPVSPTPGATTGGPIDGGVLAARVRAAMTKAGSARFALQSSKTSGPDATGALAIHGTAVSVRFDFTSGTDKLRVISVPGILYADVGEVVDGRHWLEVRAGGTDPLSSAMAPLLSYMTNSADISSQTTSWSAAGGFIPSGPTDVAGVSATEYDGTIPRAAVQAGLPAQFRDIMGKDITGDSHLRVWLDGQDRPVKVVTSGSYDGKADLVTVTYGDWGHAPAVTPPPAADVISSHS
jgi:hypothetical protein